MEIGDVAGAEVCFIDALKISPLFAEAYANLGLLLERRNAHDEAEVCYCRSIELNPNYAETHLNLGVLLAKQKRFNEAETAYKQSIALRPHAAVGWSNLGVLYACLKRENEAEQCYRTAMSLDESYATARFNLSYLLLRQGRFEEGWRCLEARNWYAALTAHFTCPRWQGEALNGKSILICYEAGYGDVIQFCRYAATLKEQGVASVDLLCHPALKTLLQELASADNVLSYDQQVPSADWDFWTPLLSIPYYCNTRIDTIPAKIPYLHATPNRIKFWRERLSLLRHETLTDNGLRVGLVWKGNPQFENDADRSLPSLSVLAPLWSVNGVNFISLQKGTGEAAHPPPGLSLTNLGPELADFADTAAVVVCLDLVICVDTSIAHLTGALGKPCWVLLPEYKTDWRWLVERTDTPWYPDVMRLFRQTKMGDWSDVVKKLVEALNQLIEARKHERVTPSAIVGTGC